MALADDGYGEGDALVEGFAGDSMGADDVAEIVLWGTLGGWGDSFVSLLARCFLLLGVHLRAPFLWGTENRRVSGVGGDSRARGGAVVRAASRGEEFWG